MEFEKAIDYVKQHDKKSFASILAQIDNLNNVIRLILNVFASCALSDNMYLISKFYKALTAFHSCKEKQNATKKLCGYLFHHYNRIDFSTCIISAKYECVDIFQLLHTKYKEYSELNEIRALINSDVSNLLDVLWDTLLQGHTERRMCISISICNHILHAVCKKNLYEKDSITLTKGKLDGYDLLFNVLVLFSESYELDDQIKKYVKICRELFYYTLRAQDKTFREPLIYAIVYVLLKRCVCTAKIICDDSNHFIDLRKTPWEYLKLLTFADVELQSSVQNEQTSRKCLPRRKEINVSGSGTKFLNTEHKKHDVVVRRLF